MELRNYLEVLAKRWMLVVSIFVLSILAAVGITLLVPPTYEADTQLFVSTQTDAANPNQQLFQGGSFSVDRVKSYAQLATSPKVIEPVVQELGLQTSAAEIAGNVQANAPPATVLLELRVTDGSPQTAAGLTNAIGTQLGRVIEELETPASGPPSPVRVSILKQAVAPTEPVWPSLPINLVAGVLIGLIVGVGTALVLESLDVTVKGPDDLARVTALPVLATVVYDAKNTDRPIARGDLHDSRSEAYRQLRTNLQFAFVDDKPGVLVVTSALSGEGKSSVAGNLALSLQQLGWNVCLVDGDLRRPSVAEYFGLVGEAGLTTALIGRASVGDVMQTAAPGFDVLTSGPIPPNPAELLASERITAVLAELSERYDMVIVDSPPTLPVADAAALASRADGTLHVISVGSTTRQQVELALINLQQVKARVLGVVLNKAPARTGGAGYYDYSSTYRPERPVVPAVMTDPVVPPTPERGTASSHDSAPASSRPSVRSATATEETDPPRSISADGSTPPSPWPRRRDGDATELSSPRSALHVTNGAGDHGDRSALRTSTAPPTAPERPEQ